MHDYVALSCLGKLQMGNFSQDIFSLLISKESKINDTVCKYMVEETERQKVAMLSTSLHV